jgi:hypothetical protein
MTSVRTSLLEGLFDPRETGPMSALLETGDADYYELRAIEFITEARVALKTATGNPDDAVKNKEAYMLRINKALSLLALAKLTR